jgi:type III secretory pathway component EscS
MLVLVLFNLATASLVLWLSVVFASVSVASLVGTLIMLYKYAHSLIHPLP